jgi:hypothetical protein
VYVIVSIVVLAIVLLIRLVIQPALKRSSNASDLSRYQHHLSGLRPPFALHSGETVIASLVARDLGAVRGVTGESPTEDAFPASFPLVYCTSERLVVLMSTTDQPTAITGTYPAHQPNLHHRIGEQFGESNGRYVSSASWRWAQFGMVVADDREVGLSWSDREGAAVVMIGFVEAGDLARFVNHATALVQEDRIRAVATPGEAHVVTDGTETTFTFEGPLVICATCSTTLADGDRYCTGCGAPVARKELA